MGFWAVVPVAVLAAAHASGARQPASPLGPSSPGVDAGGVVIKTWGLLKETTDAMTSRAQEVLHVRSELSSLSEDLATQRTAWSAAAAALAQENLILKQKVDATAVPDVETAQKRVKKIQLAKSRTLAEITRTNNSRAHSSMTWDSREKQYESQIAALEDSLKKVAADLEKSLETFHESQEEAHKTQMDLQGQLSNLSIAINKIHENDATLDSALAQNVTLLTDQNTFLQRRYDQVSADIPKVKSAALEMQPVLAQIVEAQADISHVQAEAARARGDCAQQKLELNSVLRAEREKVERRAAEVARCGSIHVQKQWLERMVASHCPAH
jgi:chromosome segregation ATPase